jgi:hypothetical protein
MRGDWCGRPGRQSQWGGEMGGKINILNGKIRLRKKNRLLNQIKGNSICTIFKST